MQIGSAKVDFDALLIEGSAGTFSMEPKVMELLKVMADNHNTVMTRDELIEAVWGVAFGGDERLSRAISLLRKALGDVRGQHTHIETIPRRGYRLIAALEQGDEPIVIQNVPLPVAQAEAQVPVPAPEAMPIVAPNTELAGQPIETALAPIKQKSRIRALAIIGLVLAGMFTLWISPIGKTVSEIPNNRRMEVGLEHIENFTRKDAIPQAQLLFASMLADDPDHAAARAGLAMALMREYTHLERDPALLQRARANAESAVRADEHLALANTAVGWVAILDRKNKQALKAFDRADILDPDNIFVLEGKTRALFGNNNTSDARRVWEKGISKYPESPNFYLLAGEQLSRTNELELAESMFRNAISLTRDNPRAYAQLSHVLHQQGKTNEAVKVIQDGLKVGETSLLYNNLGSYLFFQGQYELSANAFEKTLELSGDTHDYLYWANIGDAYRQVPTKKDKANFAYQRALQLLQVDIDKQPTHANLNSRAALYNAKLGKFEAAQTAFANVELQDEMTPIMLYRALTMFEIMGDRSKALVMLNRALDANYPLIEIKNDPELARLRQDQDYHSIISQQEREL